MTKEEVLRQLKELQECEDIEVAHINADNLITAFLSSLGHSDVTEEFNKIYKYYI